jgi:hypothetical protein
MIGYGGLLGNLFFHNCVELPTREFVETSHAVNTGSNWITPYLWIDLLCFSRAFCSTGTMI